ncbi:RNA-directed DNA polymerase, eukaryota, reverse transcriptase zinc-binding domain protein [Tanacetum coccineum]|uniref:RNA-directed DNA polymerase, eukaryota, reverse transcriptase zinc-binding domain protein n=1 Tax=Tanacetum coccineum TaxID=301880 RepID=A0ABQ4WH65_9ASTR
MRTPSISVHWSVIVYPVSLNDEDLIDIDDSSRVLLVKLNDLDSASNIINIVDKSLDTSSTEDENEIEKDADSLDDNSIDGLEDVLKNLNNVKEDEESIVGSLKVNIEDSQIAKEANASDLSCPPGFDELINSELSNFSSLSSHEKIKVLKPKITLWHATLRSNETSQKQDAMKGLQILDEKIEVGYASIEDRDSRIKLLHEIDKLDNLEVMDLIQKARIKWDVEGDENSKFFHSLMDQERKNNSINGIMHKGSQCGVVVVKKPLALMVTLLPLLRDIRTRLKLESLVANPVHINDFRPISLIGIHYKIIAKVLAIRISKLVDKIVSHEQTAFIANRQILDGPLILSEAIDWYKKRKKKMLPFKVYFEKAFDSVSWSSFYGFKNFRKFSRVILLGGFTKHENLSWLKWSNVLASFDKWGLAIGSLKSFNLALLHKWRWRFYTNPDSLGVKVIRALHSREGGFDHNGCKYNGTCSKIVGTSNYLHSSFVLPMDSIRFQVGCASLIRFWKDIWLAWSLAHDGMFSIGALCRLIDDHTLPSLDTKTTWDKCLPRKVNIFMWRLKLDRLPHRLNFTSRGIEIPEISCSSCNGNVESNDHIFFECTFAKEIWRIVRRWCDDSFLFLISTLIGLIGCFRGPFLETKSTAYS